MYAFYKEAARLAKEKQMPVILRLTTHVCHAKERVQFGAWQPVEPDNTPRFDPKNGPYIPITTEGFPMKRRALRNLEAMADLMTGKMLESNLAMFETHRQS